MSCRSSQALRSAGSAFDKVRQRSIAIDEADALACRLRLAREHLVQPLARAAHAFVRSSGWTPFGYARLGDFTRERLGRSGQWLRDLAALHEAVTALPALAAAICGRDARRPLGRVAALCIARVACSESVVAWIELARRASVRDLRASVRRALADESRWPPGCESACGPGCDTRSQHDSDAVIEEKFLVQLRLPRAVRVAFDEVLDLHRVVVGHQASAASFAEALAAEATAGPHPPDIMVKSGTQADRRAEIEARLARVTRNWRALGSRIESGVDDEILQRLEKLSLEAGAGNPAEILAQLRDLVQLEDELECRLGDVLLRMNAMRAWKALGFAGAGHYGEQRLGLCRVTVENRMGLARAARRLPQLGAAYTSGRIRFEAALLVKRALGDGRVPPEIESAWVARASEITIKRLRDELRCNDLRWARARSEGAVPDPLPPSDAEWQASLFRTAGITRARLAWLGDLALREPRADSRLGFRLEQDCAAAFLSAVESARRRSCVRALARMAHEGFASRLVSDRSQGPSKTFWLRHDSRARVWENDEPTSLLAAKMFLQRNRSVPGWVGLIALLEDYTDTWDVAGAARRWEPTYRLAGYRCMAPGCTARANLQNHHLWYRSHLGPNHPWNLLCLCPFHHQHGEHGLLARCRGRAPLGILWRLGLAEFGSWFRNERLLGEI